MFKNTPVTIFLPHGKKPRRGKFPRRGPYSLSERVKIVKKNAGQNFTVKVEPSPPFLFAAMVEPPRWQIGFTMACPRLHPPSLRRCDSSSVKKRLHSLFKFYTEMPMPVSATSNLSMFKVTVTVAAGLL